MSAELQHEDAPPLQVRFLTIAEAGQATGPMSVIPMTHPAPQAHLALVGDHRQLPPTVLCTSAKEKGMQCSMFERLMTHGAGHAVVLSIQYRMLEQLWTWPNWDFYESEVRTALCSRDLPPVRGLPWDSPLAFVNVQG